MKPREVALHGVLWVAALAGGTMYGARVLAQTAAAAAAKADAQAFGNGLVPGAAAMAKNTPNSATLPGYTTSSPSQEGYYHNADGLTADAPAAAYANDAYRSSVTSLNVRAQFQQQDLDATVARSKAIAANPDAYVGGQSVGGAQNSCTPLPPGRVSAGTYEQSCNAGEKATQTTTACNIGLINHFSTAYGYTCARATLRNEGAVCLQGTPDHCTEPDQRDDDVASLDSCSGFEQASQCTRTSETLNGQQNFTRGREPYVSRLFQDSYSCTGQVNSPAGGSSALSWWTASAGPPVFNGTISTYTGSDRDESQCAGLPVGSECSGPTEVCTDASPSTRTINGVDVTQSCWAWSRSWQCVQRSPAEDCSVLEQQGCSYERESCLTEEEPCYTYEKVYLCPNPSTTSPQTQYICGGDVYCVNGDCETIQRTANNEIGQAAAALNSVAQGGADLDQTNLLLFKGERDTCTKSIFGISNCCAPRGFPLIGECDGSDKLLKDRREKGLCHYVGSYCSSKILGVCTQKKEAHCCFDSKLARILQEQGRAQLGMDWGSPKNTQCTGFTPDQFSQLDFSRMDFSEIMADFMNAVKFPDELQTLSTMQNKISNYFTSNTGH